LGQLCIFVTPWSMKPQRARVAILLSDAPDK
jgi:hypothetical protein